jgi:amino acid adenylation domain-containing protein
MPKERSHKAEPFPRSVLEHSVVDRFRTIACRYAASLAAADSFRSYSYSRLAEEAERAAAAVASASEGTADPVAILLRNEARYAVAMLGVLAAGRGYVPLDADHPIERNRRICAHAGIAAAVCSGGGADLAQMLSLRPAQIIDLDQIAKEPAPKLGSPSCSGSDDIACITYTSGSTGEPKGVYQNHRGLLHDIMISTEALGLGPDDRLAMFNAPNLQHGTRICFGALLNGASVTMLRPKEVTATGLAQTVKAHRITVWRSTPALFAHAVETLGAGERFDDLRLVYLGGDRVGWGDYDLFRKTCPSDAEFGTHLGSTECATLHWIVDPARRSDGVLLPLGRPLPDRDVRLVDDQGAPVADGETGELVVSSRFIALGYWNDPDLTARAFTTDLADPTVRSFRTGDLARRRKDGLYEFVGRKDQQVKINGFRVEPGEVEGVLKSFAGVRDAAIVVRRTNAGIARALIAYVELGTGVAGLKARHLLALSKQALPRFMVPASIFIEPKLPRLPGMKIDRGRLAEIDEQRAKAKPDHAESPTIARLIRIFETEIGTSGATADDNVFSLGGDSLQAVRIVAELERSFGVPLSEEDFEMATSIRELASFIDAVRERARA